MPRFSYRAKSTNGKNIHNSTLESIVAGDPRQVTRIYKSAGFAGLAVNKGVQMGIRYV